MPVGRGIFQRIFLKQQLFADFEQVGGSVCLLPLFLQLFLHRLIFGISQNLSPLAAVVGDPGISVGEGQNRSAAVVGAEGAGHVGFLLPGELLQSVQIQEGPHLGLLLMFFPGNQGGAHRSHQTRIRRADHLAARVLLHGPQHRVVLKGSALHHDPVSQGVQVGETDNFGKYILDNGPAQARHQIFRLSSVALLGNDAAVHKYGAAAPQLRRLTGGKSRIGDFLYRNLQGMGKVLQEGTAAGGAGFVHQDIGDNSVIQPDGFHILSADIQNKGGVGYIFLCRPGMGHRLHNMTFQIKGFCK